MQKAVDNIEKGILARDRLWAQDIFLKRWPMLLTNEFRPVWEHFGCVSQSKDIVSQEIFRI